MSSPENDPRSDRPGEHGATPPWDPSAGSDPRTGGDWATPGDQGGPTGYGTPASGVPTSGMPPGVHPGADPYGSGGMPPGWAPKPGVVPLRPLGVGEILDGAIKYIRRYPALVLGASAIVAVVVNVVSLLVDLATGFTAASATTGTPSAAELSGVMAGAATVNGATTVVSLIGGAILSGLLMVVISRAVLGAGVDAGEAWQAARPRVLGLIGLSVLSALIVLVVVFVPLLPAGGLLATGSFAGAGFAALIGVPLAIVLGIWIGVSLALAPPVYVLEGIGVIESLKRSWRLVQPRFWPILGALVLMVLIVFAITLVLGVVFAGLGFAVSGVGAFDPTTGPSTGLLLVSALGSILTMTVYAPFQAGVTGLLYVDQRMRREGFDIELQRASGAAPR